MTDREHLRMLSDAATPGPWEAQDYDDHPGDEGSCVLTREPERGTRAIAYAIAYPWTTPESCEADAKFIAAARTAIPELLDALEQAEAKIDAVRSDIQSGLVFRTSSGQPVIDVGYIWEAIGEGLE